MPKPFFFSLRYKLILAFLATGFFISIALGYTSYRMLEKRMFKEFRENVNTVTRLSTHIVDREKLETIIQALQEQPVAKSTIEAMSKSSELEYLAEQLEFIRNTSNLVTYVYLILPTSNPNVAKQIVDADFLISSTGSPEFYSDLNISAFPVMKQAIDEKKVLIEDEYVYDEIYDTYSVSGYAPIFARDNQTFLALLGIDMANSDAEKALEEVTRRSILVAGMALFISFLIAVTIGIMMTRSIIRLDRLIRQFADNDFSVRAQLNSNDEIGRLGYSFNQMADTIQQFIAASSRFVPHDLLKLFGKESIIDVRLGDHIMRNMTVLFADVRDFTSISEKMNVKDNFNFINSYLKRIGPAVRNHHGIIDKYLGDGLMALFPERIEDAMDTAISIQAILQKYNQSQLGERYHEVRLGIGIHNGSVMVGTVGEQQRMDGTVISDAVNLASRLEGLTKYYGSLILISDEIVELLSNKEAYFIRYVDKIRVVGKSKPLSIYEVCDADEEKVQKLKKLTLKTYQEGINHFYARRFGKAADLFARIINTNPNDKPAQLFYEKASDYAEVEPAEDWDGVTKHIHK